MMKIKLKKYRLLRIKLLSALIISLSFTTFVKATSATLIDDTPLKSADNFKSKVLTNMLKGEPVEIKERKRGWYQVETANQLTGWITLLQVRFETEVNTKGSSELSKLVSLRKGHSNITATTGVRGIGENEIKNSRPDFVALDNARQFKVSESDAKKFAKEIPLKAQDIGYQENTK